VQFVVQGIPSFPPHKKQSLAPAGQLPANAKPEANTQNARHKTGNNNRIVSP
jgi:hypothetical protein